VSFDPGLLGPRDEQIERRTPTGTGFGGPPVEWGGGRPIRMASKIGIVIVTISFAFALFLIVSLLRGVFI
jgi:hypothetical protein